MGTRTKTTTYRHDASGRVVERVVRTDEHRETTTWDIDAAGLIVRETVETEYLPLNLNWGNAKATR
jgi:hypothetical protein